MSRAIRRVTADWKHPKLKNDKFQPMFDEFYGKVLGEWLENKAKWGNGTHPDLRNEPWLKDDCSNYADWAEKPKADSYSTHEFEEADLTHIQLYETITEGTPISPVFKASEFDKLCAYASAHCFIYGKSTGTAKEWKTLLTEDGTYCYSGSLLLG